MDFEGNMLSKISQTKKDKHMFSLTCGTKRSQTHRNRVEWWLPEAVGRGNEELQIKEYKLPFVRWLSSEDQIYSMMIIVYNTVLCIRKLLCMCVCVCVHVYLTLRDPVDSSLPGSSVHGIFQARILEWVSISYSRGSP